MPLEYLTVDHLSTKDLTRIFSKICIHPDVQFNGTPCWIWIAGRTLDGYGRTQYRNLPTKAHQMMFAWTVHLLPRKQQSVQIDHLCRRRSCCNPIHLDFVTAQVNVLRSDGFAAQNARKTHCKHGHPLSGDNLFYDQGKRQCKVCKRAASRRRQTKHPEAVRAAGKKWANSHKEYIQQRNKAHRDANRETYRALWRAYYHRKKLIKEPPSADSPRL